MHSTELLFTLLYQIADAFASICVSYYDDRSMTDPKRVWGQDYLLIPI